MRKAPGLANPADLMTKHFSRADADKHLTSLGVRLSGGRAESAPVLGRLDEWQEDDGELVRVHRKPRCELFTPLRVEGSPPVRALKTARVTEGKFLDTGEDFSCTDAWTNKSAAHRDLHRWWTGTTRFLRKSEDRLISDVHFSGNFRICNSASVL